jgi:hypothetical protein
LRSAEEAEMKPPKSRVGSSVDALLNNLNSKQEEALSGLNLRELSMRQSSSE